MKNLFLKTLVIGLFLLALPMRQIAQTPYEHYSNGDVVLNFHEIDNVDFRLYLLYKLTLEKQFVITPEDEYGYFNVSTNDECSRNDLFSSFDAYYHNLYTDFQLLSKDDIFEQMDEWRHHVSSQDLMSIMMDINIARATNTNNTCENADPFCTTDNYTFVAANTSSQAQSGPYYCCISSSYNPSWYYMRIGVPGIFTIHMEGHDPNNYYTQRDIDFCFWGPFNDEHTPCNGGLTASKVVDCSYSSSYSEDVRFDRPSQSGCTHHTITPSVGEYYILLITNYSQQPCVITFQKVAGSGPGETDCGILPGIASNDGPYCVGGTIQLTVNAQEGATYHWTGPNGFNSTQQNPTRPNCTMAMGGTYTCVTTVGTQSVTATTNVTVSPNPTPNFTATTVCKGETTHFTNTTTTNPANQSMSCQWDFGNGQTSTQQNPTHTYANAGNYTVTLTVTCGECEKTISKTVTVYDQPVATATATNQSVLYGGTTQLHGSGGSGTFNYHWEPANKVVNPNSQNTETVSLTETTTFSLTATHPQGGCSSTAQVNVLVEGSNMTASASATPSSICRGEETQLHAIAVGGDYNHYSYSWSPTLGLSDPLTAEPTASPTSTTTYTCTVNDTHTTQQVSVTVTVNQPEHVETTEYICPDDSFNFYGTEYSEVGDYDYETTTPQGCQKTITLHLRHYPSYDNAHTTTEAICPGQTYNFHGQYFNTQGLHSINLHTVHGCDSIVWLDLTVYPANDTIRDPQSICTTQTLTWHGHQYNQNGAVAYFDTTDYHGCLLVYKLELTVGDYQTPPNYDPVKYVCVPYDETPYYHWDIANRDYYQDATDEIVVDGPPGECDYLYTLDLRFHQEHYYSERVTECDSYKWDFTGETFTSSGFITRYQEHNFGNKVCRDTHTLDLTINNSYVGDSIVPNQCNQFVWEFGPNTDTLTEQNDYTETILTHLGCDSTVTLKLQLDYTPDFQKINGKKWVVGGSEFQYTIERYWIDLEHPLSTHETTWSLHDKDGNDFNKWQIVPYDNGDKCYLYIYTFERDTVWLHAHTESTGACECGSDDKDLWIICSSHGINETNDPCTVDIFPNPNDGNMTLSFDDLVGEALIKIFNITGTLVDQFTIQNGIGHQTHTYQSDKLTPGMYFFNIISQKGILTKKVIIID